jgi:hypothetical protein
MRAFQENVTMQAITHNNRALDASIAIIQRIFIIPKRETLSSYIQNKLDGAEQIKLVIEQDASHQGVFVTVFLPDGTPIAGEWFKCGWQVVRGVVLNALSCHQHTKTEFGGETITIRSRC